MRQRRLYNAGGERKNGPMSTPNFGRDDLIFSHQPFRLVCTLTGYRPPVHPMSRSRAPRIVSMPFPSPRPPPRGQVRTATSPLARFDRSQCVVPPARRPNHGGPTLIFHDSRTRRTLQSESGRRFCSRTGSLPKGKQLWVLHEADRSREAYLPPQTALSNQFASNPLKLCHEFNKSFPVDRHV